MAVKKPAAPKTKSTFEEEADESLLDSIVGDEPTEDEASEEAAPALNRAKVKNPNDAVIITVIVNNSTSTGPKVGSWRWADELPHVRFKQGAVVTVPRFVAEHLAESRAAVITSQ